ncbi:hypothetical protein QRO11_03970 [Paracidovorax citrulli]|uniref:DUF4124 domain-containing protein n=2 Tax=Paracidovorax citrulli TaxID=80869 RepID=A1TUG0_PARC0|nr:hypothetical protein [Paracidovorax citrulli]ABM34598.1 hypothetical protein Aave_4057 [Paracidovorax citrulli AAC00-1]ATG94044.1 hypothetical protein CQB05_08405 [Paracidovorax citrulli]MVT37302.1 hypothetical protein [Paracidovorax citrulli]PVY64037.1 hypothetical protein C8E08_1348 [Paracidovorax citrulli]QCX10011.1 hypothetical protein APS58_1101 [Paracidovorax citrulli]
MTPVLASSLMVALLWAVLPSASAQLRYSCRDSMGNVFSLSRPCPAGTVTTAAAAGPLEPAVAPGPSRYEPPSPPPLRTFPEANEYRKYMSAQCRTLQDAIRSGPARGLQSDVLYGLRREYERDCREEEQEASARFYREQREVRQQRREELRQAEAAELASRAEATRRAEQCTESRRILAAKRARTDLTDGEQKDLKRFEEVFATRCQR